MTRRARLLMLLAILALVLAVTAAPASAAEVWVTTAVTHAPVEQGFVLGSGQRLVWSAWDGNAWRVYTWKASDAQPTLLAGGATPYDLMPRVSGDRVAWHGSDGIYTWTPSGGTVRATASTQAGWPDVSGDSIVWTQVVGGSPHIPSSDVFMWTPGAGVQRMTTTGGWKGNAHISGDRITWDGMIAVSTLRVGDPAPTVLGGDAVTGNWNSQVSGDRVVWQYAPDRDNSAVREIRTWTPSGGTVSVSSAAVDSLNWTSAVSGDRIAWARTDAGGACDAYTWSAAGGTKRLTFSGLAEAGPAVWGDRVAWAAGPAGHRQIYTWTPRTGVVQVSRNGDDNADPIVTADRIAWREKIGGTYQIVTAVPRTLGARRRPVRFRR